ncbi:unnamed protein product [Porites lobata]|uniref:Uncharacterized protein n=1 Tax=Porites lobata TaxID=104759 RepID=A0ABN8RTQ2_9CNID|nr:unnamed protein product [Porites lobata]
MALFIICKTLKKEGHAFRNIVSITSTSFGHLQRIPTTVDMKLHSVSVLIVVLLIIIATWMAFEKRFAESRKDKTARFHRHGDSTPRKDDFRFTRCKSQMDCNRGECCRMTPGNHIGFCKKMLLYKERCYPYALNGLSATCPCSPGLTCAVTGSDHRNKKRIFQCISVVTYQETEGFEEEPPEKVATAKP